MSVLILLPLASIVLCQQSKQATGFLVPQHGDEPRFLTPLPLVRGEYEQLVAKYLHLTPGCYGRMTVRPSFTPEYSISVDSTLAPELVSKNRKSRSIPDEAYSYVLVATTAVGQSIYMSMPCNSDKPRKPVVVKKKRAISYKLAAAIQRVWVKSILLTQYTKNDYLGLDGADYEFSVSYGSHGSISGTTWSPDAEVPKTLVSFGDELYRYASNLKKPLNEANLIARLKEWESKIPDQK